MRHILPAASLALFLLAAAPARAVGVTGLLDPVGDELTAAQARLVQTEPSRQTQRALLTVARGLRALGRKAVARSYKNEVRAAAVVARLAERKLPTEQGVLDALGAAAGEYQTQLRDAQAEIDAAALRRGVRKRVRKRMEKHAQKLASALAAAGSADTLARRLRKLARAARLAGPFAGGDKQAAAWVIDSVALASGTQGVDLDGDGEPDNVLGGLQDLLALVGGDPFDIDSFLAEQLGSAEQLPLIELWSIDSLDDDPLVFAGLLAGADLDADPLDNWSGAEPFDVSLSTGLDGHALARTATTIAGGSYDVIVGGQALDFLGFAIPPESLVRIAATPRPESHDGVIGFAVPMEALLALLELQSGEAPGDFVGDLLRNAADLDLDGDGAADAMSGAFAFTSVPAVLVD